MPRVARLHRPHGLVHVIVRFTAGEPLLDDERAREQYRVRLADALRGSDWKLVAFAFMGNHVHLAFISGEDPLERWSRPLHTGWALWINRSQRRRGKGLGPVLAMRPATHPRPMESAPYLVAYVHNNPPKAGLCASPERSARTSHRAYLGQLAAPSFLHVDLGLQLCGFDSSPAGRRAFHAMVVARLPDELDPELEGRSTARVVRTLSLHRRSACRSVTPELLVAAVASMIGVPRESLRRGERNRMLTRARRVICAAWRCLDGHPRALVPLIGRAERSIERLWRESDAETALLVEAVLARIEEAEAA